MIKYVNVTKRYGGKAVLSKVNFEVKGGEWIWLTGKSGAGKSTLISTLIGATPIQEGQILVDDYEVSNFSHEALQEYRRHIGVIFQDYKLLPRRTVLENVAFALEACNTTQSEIKPLACRLLEKVGLEHAHRHLPHMLSGGERQRVAIARALIHEPRLIVADEPTGNLDEEATREILNLLQKLNVEGSTVIFATHNRSLIEEMKRRVIRLENGALIG